MNMLRWRRVVLPSLLGRFAHKIAFVIPGGGTLRPWLHRLRGASIGKNAWIALFVYVDELHPEHLTIGNNCTIGLRTSIFTHFYWGPRRPASKGSVVIGNDVFIGPHCVILPNVRIGDGSVIRAGTVVSRNVPPHTLWGAPAAEALGDVRIPLTAEHGYEQFAQGIRLRVPPRGREAGRPA